MSTPFDLLPPELLESILRYTTASLSTSERDRNYSTCALVNSSFRNSSQRLLFDGITILDGTKIRKVIESINNYRLLGLYIRSLKVVFASGADVESRGFPTPAIIREFDLVSREDFFTLIALCPNIYNLTMEHPSFLLTNLRTGTLLTEFTKTSLPPLFENLTSLTLMTANFDTNQDLLREMLVMGSNLSHLHLGSTKRITTRSRTTNFLAPPRPATICSSLTSLKVEGSFYNRIVFNSDGEDSFLPLSSLTRLKVLELPGGIDLDRLEPIAKICGSTTLESLTFRFPTNYSELSPLLPYFTVLTTLSLTLHETPVDFLQQIPTTIQHLHMKLPLATLQHFQSHPRPSLRLLTIGLPPDPRIPEPWLIFNFIPSSVKRLVYFGSDLTAERALKDGLIKVKEFEMPGCRFFKGVEQGCKEAGIIFGRTGW